MNKIEKRELAKIVDYTPTLGLDFATQALGTLHRSSMSKKSQREIEAFAAKMGVSIL